MKWMGFLNFMATTSDILSFKDEKKSLKQKINEIFFPSKCGAHSGEAETEFPARTLLQFAELPKSKWQSN